MVSELVEKVSSVLEDFLVFLGRSGDFLKTFLISLRDYWTSWGGLWSSCSGFWESSEVSGPFEVVFVFLRRSWVFLEGLLRVCMFCMCCCSPDSGSQLQHVWSFQILHHSGWRIPALPWPAVTKPGESQCAALMIQTSNFLAPLPQLSFIPLPVSLSSCLAFRLWGSSALWWASCLTLTSSWSNRRRGRAAWLKDHRLNYLSINCTDTCHWLPKVWPAAKTSLYIFYFNMSIFLGKEFHRGSLTGRRVSCWNENEKVCWPNEQ